jgi:hypothetical protein
MPRRQINYSKTIIYKLVCNDLNVKDLYVGHTTDFTRRKSAHKNACENTNGKAYNYKIYETIRKNGGWNCWSMIQIEEYPCKSLNEATARERYWFETLNANLNQIYPQRDDIEYGKYYRASHKVEIYERNKKYVESNREKVALNKKLNYEKIRDERLEKDKIKFTCDCGSVSRIQSKSRHLKTLKHLDWITQNEPH